MMLISARALYPIFCVLYAASVAEACNETALKMCVENQPSGNSQEQHMFFSDEDRKNFCNSLRQMQTCIQNTACHKDVQYKPMYKGFVQSVKFACGQSEQQKELMTQCWKTQGLQRSEEFCVNRYANSSEQSLDCDERSDLISCFVRSVKKCCGNETAEYVGTSVVKLFQPTYKQQHCRIHANNDVVEIEECPDRMFRTASVNIAVIVSVSVIIVVAIVVVIVVYIVNKRRGKNTPWLSIES